MKKSYQTIGVGEFKAHCLRLCEEIYTKRGTLILTKRGKPIVKLTPISDSNEKESPPQTLVGTITFEEDIVSPLKEAWEALR